MKLTAENVEKVLMDCLFKPEEVPDGKMPEGAIVGEGLIRRFAFHPERLKAHEKDITDMLAELPLQFKDGWSFLNGCITQDETQWGEQPTVEELFALGCAIGKGRWVMREMASVLPGGVPYYKVLG